LNSDIFKDVDEPPLALFVEINVETRDGVWLRIAIARRFRNAIERFAGEIVAIVLTGPGLLNVELIDTSSFLASSSR